MANSSVLVSGPSQWYVNTGDADGDETGWEHLGMCESDTILELSPQWQGITLDGSVGSDFDRQLMGVSAMVSGDLARWHEDVLDRLKTFLNDSQVTPGQYPAGFFGSMARTEDMQFGLCIVAQYAAKDAYKEAEMPGVYYFPFVFPQTFRRNLSSRAMRERIAFEAIVQSDGQGGGVLYFTQISFDLPTPT